MVWRLFLPLQIMLMSPENNKISVLLGALDFSPDVGQKTVIVTNSIDEVEDVFKVKRPLQFSSSSRLITLCMCFVLLWNTATQTQPLISIIIALASLSLPSLHIGFIYVLNEYWNCWRMMSLPWTSRLCFCNFQAVSNKSAFCLKTHEKLAHEFDFVSRQWRKDICPGTHVILGKLECINKNMKNIINVSC